MQRKVVNNLLNARSAKFGQFDESLIRRTGIFGLKTKRDMQKSIDILTDIVRTDNNILKETKVLLDYKDLEKTQVKDRYVETESRTIGFMSAINKLQRQNEKIQANLIKSEKQINLLMYVLLAFTLLVFGTGYYLVKKKKLTLK